MTTPAECRKFASDCMREAERVDSTSVQLTMVGLARIGLELERYAKAVRDGVETRLRPQGRKPRRPDVCGYQITVLAGFQCDLEQVAGVEPDDRPPVAGEVAARLQERLAESGRRLEVGHVDQVMDLAGALVSFVDRRDLDAQHETGRIAGAQQWREEVCLLLLEPEKSGRIRDEVFLKVGEPGRVGEVAGAEQRDALAPRPVGEVGQLQIPAACPRIP